MSHSYAHAWGRGARAARLFGRLAIPPFWRGKKYRKAWENGFRRIIACRSI